MTWAAVAVGGATLIGSAMGAKGGKKQRKQFPGQVSGTQTQLLDKYDQYSDESGVRGELSKFSDLAGMFGQDASKSYMDTSEGMSFSRMIDDQSQKRRKRLQEDTGMMNLTPEAYLAGLGDINEQEGASMNQLVTGADARRRSLRSQQMQALSQVLGGEQGLFGAQQARFMNTLGSAQNIQSGAYGMQMNSNNNSMQLLGQGMNSIVPLIGQGK